MSESAKWLQKLHLRLRKPGHASTRPKSILMRSLALVALAAAVQAQQVQMGPYISTPFLRTDPNLISVNPTLRTDPPKSPLEARFTATVHERSSPNGPGFYSRILVDHARHAYLGYELLIERKQPGIYLATVGRLGVTPMDLAVSEAARFPIDFQWAPIPLPSIPEPREIHEGEVFSIELYRDPGGEKLFDDIRINPRLVRRFSPVPVIRPVPTVSGTPRDFSAADAELQLVQPRDVILNGTSLGAPMLRNVRGPLVWLYLPGMGRYIMSLAPHPGLDFVKAGEVRGGAMSFTQGADIIKLECIVPMAAGDAPYNLWVLHDKDWEPISEAQKDHPGIGSVGAAELAALKRN
jgi:hypothetical protein